MTLDNKYGTQGSDKMKQRIENQVLAKDRKRSGSALVLIVLVVLISMAIGTGLLTMGTNAQVTSMRRVQDMQARSAADAGMELVVQEINNAVINAAWSEAVLPTVNNAQIGSTDSYYSVKTAYLGTDGYYIYSNGTNNSRSRTVIANLRLKGLFEEAVLCRNNITLKSGTTIDAVDSDISMDPADCDEKVVIGTNSVDSDMITLNNGVTVDGDVVVGVGGDVDSVIKDLGATVDTKYAMSSDVEFPPVSPPSLPGLGTSIAVKTGEKTVGSGGDYPGVGRVAGIRLRNGTTLRVVGDCTLYVTGDVDMGQSSEITLEPGASLTIYLDGDWISDNNSSINNTPGKPTNFKLYGTGPLGQEIDLKAKSDFLGSIYAPNADLTIFSGGDLFGSFTANNFELKNPARFYYDAALKEVDVTDEGARFVVSRWYEN